MTARESALAALRDLSRMEGASRSAALNHLLGGLTAVASYRPKLSLSLLRDVADAARLHGIERGGR